MPSILRYIPFSENLLHSTSVQGFDCGDKYWEKEVSGWLKVPDEWLKLLCEVWLYVNEWDELVGFGSLAPTKWKWPDQTSPRVPGNLIPAMALGKGFRKVPKEPDSKRYSIQIIDHLISETRNHPERQRFLGLYVHPDNEKAIGLYREVGFIDFHHRWLNKEINREYLSMVLKLPSIE